MFDVPTMSEYGETVYLLALLRANDVPWHRVATLVDNAGTAKGLVSGEVPPANELAQQVVSSVRSEHIKSAAEEVREWKTRAEVAIWTILDDDYPSNLRTIFNRPPLIFCKGKWNEDVDRTGLAVVGTRNATKPGLGRAKRLAEALTERGFTVISGLALGIDTAAHTAALESGGRTVAVMGSGTDVVYPPANAALARAIVESGGALISQFVPNQRPSRASFPMRNAVMSGLAMGTIVVEAGPTSGAKMQARLALEHGRPVFLLQSLVDKYEWARDYATKGRYRSMPIVVREVDDIVHALDKPDPAAHQLSLRWHS